MPFVAPLALLGLLFIPLVVAMYLLKLRRDERIVPSTILWTRLVADVEANAPWQKLRRSLLLLLQLLLVALIALLAARPFLERPAGLAGDIVLVVDTSASMGATDVAPGSADRLEAAKRAAADALRDLPSGGKVSLVAAGRTARVVTNQTSDVGRVREAINGLSVESSGGDLGDALRLASALAARSDDAQVLVVTDAALADPPATRVDAPIRVVRVGDDRGRRNQAIVALAVRTAPSAVTRSVFISVVNTDLEPAERRLVVYGDGEPIEARDVFLDAQARTDVSIDDIPRDVATVEVRLVRRDGTGDATVDPDQLAIDDRAWAIVPPDHLTRVLLVTEGDPYLETALTYLPNAELYGVKPADYGAGTHPELFDLIIFEGFLPDELPARPILAIAPSETSDLGEVDGFLREPGIGSLDPAEPILRNVDLSTTHIGEARKIGLPAWARTILPGPGGAPLLYAGDRAGVRTAVMAFEPRHSDLPLQVAFPILIANLTGELLGGSAAPTGSVTPGSPVTLPIPAGATSIQVTRPDGTAIDLVPATTGGRSVVFSQTDQLGVYTVAAIGLDPSAAPTTDPSGGAASPSPATSPTAMPIDPTAPTRFAVNLFDIGESSIAPGSAAAIEALGVDVAGGEAPANRPDARDELWIPLLLIVLALLLVEWAVYERDALARFRRGLSSRLGAIRRSGRGA